MINLKFDFSNPLLLLVFLFGAGLTALLYFRLSKKYRKTRNRIISIVLHLIVFALAVLTLAGMTISYETPNKENQIILLVDVSDTEESSAEARDDFIETVLTMGQYDEYRIGIVTFGYDQIYAVPLTDEIDTILPAYLAAQRPDASATDIAAALNYAATLFEKTESAKIVLITDGKETDEEAASVIRTISAKGIKVDVANIPSSPSEKDICLSDVVLPDYHVSLGEECSLSVTVFAKEETDVGVEFYDNGNLIETQLISVSYGSQNVAFRHAFDEYGLHQLCFKLRYEGDEAEENNICYSYLYLEQFNRILILEQNDESEALKSLLTESDEAYQVTVMNIRTEENLPETLGALCEYDQIILNNIANRDMPEGFAELLYRYVSECGGGLFTVGGSDETGNAHAYNRSDLLNTTYQDLLPVQAINYTPPVAVMVIVDRSGSMSSADDETGATKYDLALSGAASCLNALTERDYFGLMTLDSDYETLLPLTPRSQEAKIIAAINNAQELGTTGGTVFPSAIQRACQALRSLDVAKRHIIIVSDGQVPETQREEYESYIKYYHDNDGITLSVVGIGITPGSTEAQKMGVACEIGGGRLHAISNDNMRKTTMEMREDLNAPEIKEVNMETFNPTVKNALSALFNKIDLTSSEDGKVSSKMKVSLDGFYGVKVKSAAELVLAGDFDVPIYAQWRVGKGSVGSFMCDLNGTWSSDFMNLDGSSDGSGRRFLLNVISALMPMENIREDEISVTFFEDNYTNKVSIYADLKDGEKIVATITNMTDDTATPVSMNEITAAPEGLTLCDLDAYVTSPLEAASNFSRCDFVIKESGVYKIEFSKQDANGNELASMETYRSFSYSEEYDAASDETETDIEDRLRDLASHANGSLIEDNEDPNEIFANFVTAILHTYDPRYLFMILIIVLFLADIAVRKFKFKWLHEIIRERRAAKKPR